MKSSQALVCNSILAAVILTPVSGVDAATSATTFLAVPNRTDMVYDDLRHTLYITAGSSLERYDVQNNQFLSPIVFGDTVPIFL
jgi:hypothetical protein